MKLDFFDVALATLEAHVSAAQANAAEAYALACECALGLDAIDRLVVRSPPARRAPSASSEMTTNYTCYCAVGMRRVNALELRQSLGKVLSVLHRSGQPVIIEKRGQEVAVLISLRDFHERFSEKAAAEERDRLIAEMDALAASAPVVDETLATHIIREIRGYSD